MIDINTALELQKEAKANGGKCTHCHQILNIYRYGISKSMVKVLRKMASVTEPGTGRAIDVDKLGLEHSQRTQLTKMRLHGLVAKVKEDGHQVARNWLITRKGWQFLGNEPVPAKVVVYNNQVLGHNGGTVEIKRIEGGNGEYEARPVTEPESRQLADVRNKPQAQYQVRCVWRGSSDGSFTKGQAYDFVIGSLKLGGPVNIEVTDDHGTHRQITYQDIAAYNRRWQAVK